MKTVISIFTLLCLGFIITSCSDDSKGARLIVTLTDSPGDYEEVNVDIQSVEVHRSTGTQTDGWIELENINAAVYDLVELSNGTEVVLSDGTIPEGFIAQMRLILGSNNSVVIDGQSIALTVPSGAETGLKLLINEDLEADIPYTFKLDFDAARSVVKAGATGNYNLRPVVKVITETSGGIRGSVTPASEVIAVYAMQGMDTVRTSYAMQDVADFQITGLDAGSYDVVFDPGDQSTYVADTVENVNVNIGEFTEMDPVALQQ